MLTYALMFDYTGRASYFEYIHIFINKRERMRLQDVRWFIYTTPTNVRSTLINERTNLKTQF
jgi:hypothetical protein